METENRVLPLVLKEWKIYNGIKADLGKGVAQGSHPEAIRCQKDGRPPACPQHPCKLPKKKIVKDPRGGVRWLEKSAHWTPWIHWIQLNWNLSAEKNEVKYPENLQNHHFFCIFCVFFLKKNSAVHSSNFLFSPAVQGCRKMCITLGLVVFEKTPGTRTVLQRCARSVWPGLECPTWGRAWAMRTAVFQRWAPFVTALIISACRLC